MGNKHEKAMLGGVSYYPDHWPKDEWERDMRLIKQSGLDIIRFGEFSWAWIERTEGKFNFSEYDEFMELAHRLELKVMLCTPTAAPPQWLLHKYPHVRQLDQNNRPHRGGRHMICYNDPIAKQLAERVIEQVVGRYKKHPALIGWQIDNEPTAGESISKDRIYDYHPAVLNLFHDYLKLKWGDLNKLNSAWVNGFWSHTYTSWDEIEAPRDVGGNPSLWLEWMRFRDQNVVDSIQWQAQLILSMDADAFIGTNIPEVGTTESCWLAQDYWKQSQGLHFIGTDLYLYEKDLENAKQKMAFSCDLIRSAADAAGAEFWISETQAGPHRLPWRVDFAGGLWDESFLLDSAVTYAAHGAKHLLFFLWRPLVGGQEFGMNGLVHFDGSPNELTHKLPEIMEAARQAMEEEGDQKPVLYMHYSRDSLLLTSAYDPDNTMQDCLLGWHKLVSDLGYRIIYIHDDELSKMAWTEGNLLVLPYSLVIGEAMAEALQRATDQGVRIIGSFGTGYFNEFGTIEAQAPGYKLANLFGLHNRGFDLLDKQSGLLIDETMGEKPGILYAEILVTEGQVLRRDLAGRPLLIGKGTHRFIAFDVGSYYERKPHERAVILEWCRNGFF